VDRGLGDQAVDDEHDRGRDHRAQAAAGADRADGEVLVVAEPEHLRQRHEAEQHDLAADDAAHRRHDDGHDGGDDGDAAAQPLQPDVERVVHVARDAAPL
jgi:hypothetical protein